MVGAVLAALTTLAGLASKASKDAADADAQKRARALHKQEMISGILHNRAQVGGADTSRSQLAGSENEFLRQLAAGRRDTSGDWVPFVQGLGSVAQNIAADVNQPKASKPILPPQDPKPAAPRSMEYPSYGTPVDDEDERNKFLASLSRRGGWYS